MNEIVAQVKEDFENYILKECEKFCLNGKTTDEEIEKYYFKLTGLDDDKTPKQKKLYLYNYILDDMEKNGEITSNERKKFENHYLKNYELLKNKLEEMER